MNSSKLSNIYYSFKSFSVLFITLIVSNNSYSYEILSIHDEAWLPSEFNILDPSDSHNGKDAEAMQMWNNYADIFSIITPRQTPEWNNGVSDIAGIFDDNEVDDYFGSCFFGWLGAGHRGIALPELSSCVTPAVNDIYDIAINANGENDLINCPNNVHCFSNTIIHELGHAIGLGHTTDLESIMTDGDSERPWVGRNSMQLYPNDVKYLYVTFPNSIKPNVIDLGVWPNYYDSSINKWVKADVVGDTNGFYLLGEDVYVTGLFIGNMGANTLNNSSVKLFLSLDESYDLSDIEVKSIPINSPMEEASGLKYDVSFTIPSNISSGQNYNIIAVAFFNGIAMDLYEYNNEALIRIIAVYPPPQLSIAAEPSTLTISNASILTATMLDSFLNPVPNAMVSFSTGYSGGFAGCTFSGSNCNTTTNASGVASVTFTSTIPGTATISATGENGGTDSTTVTFQSTSLNVTVSPNPVNVAGTTTITANLGAAGASQVVTFSTSFPGLFSPGNVSGSTQATANGSGVATTNFVPASAGNAIFTIDSPVSDAQAVSLEVVDPNADKQISFAVSYASGGSNFTRYNVEALVTNAQGQPVVGQVVDFVLLTSNGSFLDTHEITGAVGKVDVDLNITSSGTTTFKAIAGTAERTESFQAFVGQVDAAEMIPVKTFNMIGDVYGLDFSPDENSLYAATKSGYVRGWNTSNYSNKFSQFDYGEDLYQLSVRPDNNAFLVGTGEGVAVYSSTGGYICSVNPQDFEQRTHVAWTSNSSWLETTYYNLSRRSSQCGSSSTPSGQPSAGHEFDPRSGFDYNSDISRGALSTSEGEVIIVNSSGNLVTRLTLSAGDNAYDTDFSSDGSKLVAVGINSAKIFSTATWAGIGTLTPSGISGRKYGATFLDNDTKVAIGGNGRVEVMGASGGPSSRFANINGLAIKMDWNESTKELAVGTSSGYVYIFKPLQAIDNIKPIISVATPINNIETNLVSINTSGAVTDNIGITSFTINGNAISFNASGNFSTNIVLSAGSNTITYIATDAAGNSSTVTRTVTRLVDSIAPSISGTSVTPSQGVIGTSFVINTTIIDESGIQTATATVKTNAGAIITTLPMSNSGGDNFQVSFDSSAQSLGFYKIDIQAIDNSGFNNTRTIIDATGFEIIDAPPDDVAPVISNVDVNPLQGEQGTEFVIVADVIDVDSQVASVTAKIKTPIGTTIANNPMSLSNGNTYTTTWNSTGSAQDVYAVDIIAIDTSPLANQTTLTDAVVLEITPDDLIFSGGFESNGSTFQDCPTCPIMTNIPGGTFQMGDITGNGSSNELPVHSVTVPDFAMGIYEVTFDEWDACFAAAGCSHNPSDEGWGRGSRPVINVSWDDAKEYVAWLRVLTNRNYRLPSESEWEYATRTGSTTDYWWGNNIGVNQANCRQITGCEDSFQFTSQVGSFSSNPFGLFDVHGNVWEWIEDCWNISYDNAPNDGTALLSGDCNLRPIRSGSWYFSPEVLRSSHRDGSGATARGNGVGFRVALGLGNFTFQECPNCPIMTNIPGGTFQMGDITGNGSSNELPVHPVTVPDFAMGIYEVTFDEWDACFAAGDCSHNPSDNGYGRGNHPVINVNWFDIQEYVIWLSTITGKMYRLPSESEWEYAVRAGTTTDYWWGNQAPVCDVNVPNGSRFNDGASCNAIGTAPVGSYSANPFGLYDVHGNVSEFTEDYWNASYSGAPTDGSAWLTGDSTKRLLRGGSHHSSSVDRLRSAKRLLPPAIQRNFPDGFRVAMTQSSQMIVINDTGITWGGNYSSGNNATCTSNITSPQDCHQGRDFTHDDDSDGHAGFSFTKLDTNGNSLLASATSWSCVKDNVTGLIWEVKTDDAGLHDKGNAYRWGGVTHLGSGFGTYYNDWDTLVDGSNSANFCGYNDWRVPTTQELISIVDNSRINPSIDINYFKNTNSSDFWSASPNASSSNFAWGVGFGLGSSNDGNDNRSNYQVVRLVRFGQ